MTTAAPLLARRSHRAGPSLTLWGEMGLPLCRAHELCGRARRTLAVMVAAQMLRGHKAQVFWIAPGWGKDALYAPGLVRFLDPGALTFVTPNRAEDLLWSVEEVLRAGIVPLVVADLPGPPGLVPVRRLHLAAEAGAERGVCQPLALLLTPGDGGAPGIETRHRMEPAHLPNRDRWRLDRLRARMAPPRTWWLENGRLAPAPDGPPDRAPADP